MTTPLRLSILDLALVGKDQPVREALLDSVTLAQKAESLDRFERIWFAEHHNMPQIASAATSVLIAHVAASTERIRVGSGGVMLPNHAPLVIAEQFGTLAELHPGRIDLGLGRAPGTDQRTVRALRRDPSAADTFPDDVRELQGYLGDESLFPGVTATPGKGTHVPLYILGSSLYGAQLAAAFGLPYAFASHFAPDALQVAVATYRERFVPSQQLAEPYVIAACNTIVADDPADADAMYGQVLRERVRRFFARGPLTDEQLEEVVAGPGGDQARSMMRHTGVGDGPGVAAFLRDFADFADADEVMLTNVATTKEARHRALDLLADA
ncbi:MAG TPA: LLM class flavin-dependent oxidoreductase [Propionibacteriaceae bacterium]|nr:LLM class flavin-dependent oxidoreductase [Propionibacteriaceae bacterium]